MTDGFVVRTAIPDDEASVTALLRASYPPLMAPAYDATVLAGAMPLMTRANPVLLASGTFYVAQAQEDGMVGCGGWTPERPGTGEREPGLAHIRHFATHPAHAGRGIGRALLETCEAAARAAGFERFECYSSLNAEPFYAALGFAARERFDVIMTPETRLPSVRMTRRIA